jgi:hypothetical protein
MPYMPRNLETYAPCDWRKLDIPTMYEDMLADEMAEATWAAIDAMIADAGEADDSPWANEDYDTVRTDYRTHETADDFDMADIPF